VFRDQRAAGAGFLTKGASPADLDEDGYPLFFLFLSSPNHVGCDRPLDARRHRSGAGGCLPARPPTAGCAKASTLPGTLLGLHVFWIFRVGPWRGPDNILTKARKAHFGGKTYDDHMITRPATEARAFGRAGPPCRTGPRPVLSCCFDPIGWGPPRAYWRLPDGASRRSKRVGLAEGAVGAGTRAFFPQSELGK